MFMYFDLIAEKTFTFRRNDVENVCMHDNAMFAMLRGGGEFKVVDIPESLTKQEFFEVAKAFAERLDEIHEDKPENIQ